MANCSVSAPIPGPISIAPAVLSISAWLIIFSNIFTSIKKFCPRLFLKENLYLFKIALVLEGVAIYFFVICCPPCESFQSQHRIQSWRFEIDLIFSKAASRSYALFLNTRRACVFFHSPRSHRSVDYLRGLLLLFLLLFVP